MAAGAAISTLLSVIMYRMVRLRRALRKCLAAIMAAVAGYGSTMTRRALDLWSPAIGASGAVIAYGHWGRPVLVFPTEAGRACDFESNGMVDAVADLLDAGPRQALLRRQLRRRVVVGPRHPAGGAGAAARGVRVVDRRPGRCRGSTTTAAAGWRRSPLGASMGAYHAANFALRRADLFPQALCLSGNYDPTTWHGWGEQGDALYFQNPTAYVANLHGDHLDWLRSRRVAHARLRTGHVGGHHGRAGQHPEDGGSARREGHPHELDLWGARRRRTTGRAWRASWPTTCHGLLS